MPKGARTKKPAKKTPTIVDVARKAGVSPATVSNVLGGQRGVRSESRAVVLKAADALGYQSNYMASSLRRGTTRTIGVVVPNLTNEFFSGLVTHWEAQAAGAGYEIIVVASGDNTQTERRRIESAIARRVDGLLIAATVDDFGGAKAASAKLPPMVLVDRAFGHPRFDTVSSDNLHAGYLGTRHLIELGHRDIVALTSADTHLHLRSRIEGYRKAMREAGLQNNERWVVGGPNVEACRAVIEPELRRADAPTAIFATTFYSTLGAIKAIQALGIPFPEQISLVAFEQSEWLTVFRPYLTAVVQDRKALAESSWQLLMERIAQPQRPLRQMEIPVRFDIRESAQPLKAYW